MSASLVSFWASRKKLARRRNFPQQTSVDLDRNSEGRIHKLPQKARKSHRQSGGAGREMEGTIIARVRQRAGDGCVVHSRRMGCKAGGRSQPKEVLRNLGF